MGGDSHTPHGGSIGMLCIGVGGMDVATAMTGIPMRLKMPRVIKVNLTGNLKPGVNAKEVILEMLRKVTIKGRPRKCLRICRRGHKEPGGTSEGYHNKYGSGDGSYYIYIPCR